MSADDHLSPDQFETPSADDVAFSAGRMRLSDISRPGSQLGPRQYQMRSLVSDIRRNGIEQPLAVETRRFHDGSVRHTVFNGSHRHEAGIRARAQDAPVVVSHPRDIDPPLSDRRPATRDEYNAAYGIEREGRWA